jgi:tetratricopeptide (TPR) repeat protein
MAAGGRSWEAEIRRAHEHWRAGRSKEAASCLVAVIKECPGSLPAYRLLADVQHSLGNRTAEAAVLDELATLDPLSARTWGRLGSVQADRGFSEEAYIAYRQASRLMPAESSNWQGLARSAFAVQRFSRAEEAKDQLLRRFPNHSASHLLAGHIQKALGNSDGARAAYDAALALDPDSSETIYNRVDLDPPGPDQPVSVRMERMLLDARRSDTDAANLHFALAHIFEAAKNYNQAYLHYEKANEAMSRAMADRGIRYRPADAEASVARTLSTYPASAFSTQLDPLPIELRPLFIVGMPRSGTSMVEQMFASHPRVAAGGELSIARDCELLFLRRRREAGLSGPIDSQHSLERELLIEIRQVYVDRLLEQDLDADFVTDKLPGNFARLPFIRLLFPEAVIVHCKRHPIANCWSLFTANFALHDPYYNSLEHLVHYYRCYEQIMSHWRAMLPKPMVETTYEGLVANPQIEIRRLIEGAGLDWSDECMAFHELRRPMSTASYAQARTHLYSTSIDRWRHYEPRLETLKDLCP